MLCSMWYWNQYQVLLTDRICKALMLQKNRTCPISILLTVLKSVFLNGNCSYFISDPSLWRCHYITNAQNRIYVGGADAKWGGFVALYMEVVQIKKKTNNKHQCTVNLTGLAHSMRLYSVLQLHLFQYSWILLNFIYALWKSLHWLQFVINYNKIHFF